MNQVTENTTTQPTQSTHSAGRIVLSENHGSTSKVERYGWTLRDQPGEFRYIHKNLLRVNHQYQREPAEKKVSDITRDWSWVGCGVILVAMREDIPWVLDGQHRVLAALRRADVQELPCMVFELEGVQDEAKGFVSANTLRKPMTALQRFKGMSVAGDPLYEKLSELLKREGIKVVHPAKGPRQTACVGNLLEFLRVNEDHARDVIWTLAQVCHDGPLTAHLIRGSFWLAGHLEEGLQDARLLKRMIEIGSVRLNEAAWKAVRIYGKGNSKAAASGMLDEINKGLRNKIVVNTLGS